MKRRRTPLFALASLLILVAFAGAARAKENKIQLVNSFPDFSVEFADGIPEQAK
jgi:hypothetical protein